ncbi:MAG: M42 family metallopeptidase [Eubacteriales bacterium]|nr:M42 family metallopeptidase [Eubacteriales bacterium]
MMLERLTQSFGPSGREKEITQVISEYVTPFSDEVYTDALGNLIAHKKGNGKKIMLAAHMDEIGVAVTYIDEKGFLRFSKIGGLYQRRLLNRRVRFSNGFTGVIDTEENNKDYNIQKMYIDIGATDREQAEKMVSVGDMAVFEGEYKEEYGVIISKALDNRAGCYILIKVLEQIKSENDIYFCFTSQEEVGLRGAKAAAYSVNPEYALAVDVTDTGDTPNCPKMAVNLGGGAAVKVMDRSVITNPDVRIKLIELAKKNNIPYQLEIMTDGGTDAGAIHTSREGVKTGGVSVPTRYIHSPSEMVSKKDLEACIKLIKAFCESNL